MTKTKTNPKPRTGNATKSKVFTGYLQDEPDDRDYALSALNTTITDIDMSEYVQYIRDQKYNNCVTCAIDAAFEMENRITHNKKVWVGEQYGLADGFLYTLARQEDGSFPENVGTYPRKVLKIATKVGMPPDKVMPYAYYKVKDEPDLKAKLAANFYKIKRYEALSKEQIPYAVSNKKPVVFGMLLDNAFVNYKKGEILTQTTDGYYGGHAMVIAGLKIINGQVVYKILNSWGRDKGNDGYYLVSQQYFNTRLYEPAWAIYV